MTRDSRLNSFQTDSKTRLVVLSVWLLGLPGAAASAAQSFPEVQTVSNLDAGGGAPVYFSFADNAVTDSSNWDVSFNGTTIGVNGGAIVLGRAFQRVDEAPESGYRADGSDGPAISTAEGERWFDYDPNTHVVTPIPFLTIVVRTKDRGHAKVEIVDYYDAEGTPRHYTFRFVYQPDGSGVFAARSDD